ncbi:cytochrome c maturation protein CcmE domain-containing protein [Conexibacter woesei]|uniref:Cytochrome c-type biogenesis protein CcmE-like protein n=1 Tax=Conexibacter woesei (strain DSM 14684 / CCUG 47730 / CIP 108061 / JCM 11494 / NBRC 100937 / ID131577) TaxID=469383 RepID=D3F7Z8_CONWI|nr:cytochrome c maturation protein CcmE [Conexibacter woesei]ADB52892.1 Cytochrome c-type biogenesis protein CcmE-like protein [Conexibacter woesei DSM 14684]
MDPSRKRRIRLVVAATAAMLLASALIYTSFSAGSDEKTAGQLLESARAGETYTLAGTVAPNSVRREDGVLWFRILDPHREVSARVRYTGLVPDPFREGRGVMIKVQLDRNGLKSSHDTLFIAEKDSMVTKCPSKFQVAPEDLPRGAPEDLLRTAPTT